MCAWRHRFRPGPTTRPGVAPPWGVATLTCWLFAQLENMDELESITDAELLGELARVGQEVVVVDARIVRIDGVEPLNVAFRAALKTLKRPGLG